MKKNVVFVIFLVILFGTYFLVVNKKKNYELEYVINTYTIKEVYDKTYNSYYINVYNNLNNYSFVSSKKYSNKRHIIDNIDVKETDGTTCVKPISKYLTFSYVCSDDNNYFVENKDVVNTGSKENYDNYSVYNKSNKYYVWDGYGIKNVLSRKEIHFLDKEHYDNSLSFNYNEFILFADYDAGRSFSDFYYVDIEKETSEKIESQYDISFDSYFLGYYKNKVYLFDKKNMVEYFIDLKKKKVIKVSKKEIGKYYDGTLKDIALSKLKYTNMYFDYKNIVNYVVDNNKLYKYYNNSKEKMMLTNIDVKSIISCNDEKVYYLSNDSLYSYDEQNGNVLLLSNFDWKFNYLNRIFIF